MKYAIRIVNTRLYVLAFPHHGRGSMARVTYEMLLSQDMLEASLYNTPEAARTTLHHLKAKMFAEVVEINGSVVSVVPAPPPVKNVPWYNFWS